MENLGIGGRWAATRAEVQRIAEKFLLAVQHAGKIYRDIVAAKGADKFFAEASMDETDSPQTPLELLVILVALADAPPVQTIAQKFTVGSTRAWITSATSRSSSASFTTTLRSSPTPSPATACPRISSSASTPAATSFHPGC